MGEALRNMSLESLISHSQDLVRFLTDKKDLEDLSQCLRHSHELLSSHESDFEEVHSSIRDHQKKIDEYREKAEESKHQVAAGTDPDHLEKELDEELHREQLLKEELRVIADEISELENKRVSVEERKQALRKEEQVEKREQKKLSMYACVTNIIPKSDKGSQVSGHIVDRDKKVVQKFEFDSNKLSDFDICNCIWKMIDS